MKSWMFVYFDKNSQLLNSYSGLSTNKNGNDVGLSCIQIHITLKRIETRYMYAATQIKLHISLQKTETERINNIAKFNIIPTLLFL